MATREGGSMNIDKEREAFEKNPLIQEKINYLHGRSLEFLDGEYYCPCQATQGLHNHLFVNGAWLMHLEQAKKLEGCVVVPEDEYNEMAQYKDLYKRAIVNAKKRKDQLNWAHVVGLGVGSTKAVELLKELGIDPSATSMHAMVEAARGGK